MNRVALLLACLACAGHARRVHSSARAEQADAVGAGALANLLLASTSGSAFNPSAAGLGVHVGSPSTAVMRAPEVFTSPKLSRRQALLAVPAAALLLPRTAQAAIPTVKLAGSYIDPFHPGCKRDVKVDGKDVVITGTDEVGGPTWSVKAKVNGDSGLLVDFSPKGGPTEVPAEWIGDAFKFPDGNVWSKITEKYRKLQIRIATSYYNLDKTGSQYKILVSKGGVSIDGSDGLGPEKKWKATGYFVGPGEIEFTKDGDSKKIRAKWNDVGMKLDDGSQWSEQRIASVGR